MRFGRGIRIILILFAYLLVCVLAYLGVLTYRHNLVGWFLLFSALAYGLGGPYLLVSNLSNKNVVRQERQDRSFWYVLPGFFVVYYVSPLEYLYLARLLPRAGWMQIAGVLLIAVSLFIFTWAFLALKGAYSGRVWVRSGQTLVMHGPYRYVRHPAYAAYLLMALGISIGFSSLVSLLGVPLLLLPGLIYRMKAEEKILSAQFGEQYSAYSLATKRLLPRIW